MRYLTGTIFSSGAGNPLFEDNFERIFPKKPKMGDPVALSAVCGGCAVENLTVYANPTGPIAICAACWEQAQK